LNVPELKTLRAWRLLAYVWRLARIVRREDAALTHCDTLPLAILSGFAARLTGVPAVFHARVADSGGLLDRLAPLLCDRIIAVSEAAAARFGGLPALGRVRLVYNGADLAQPPSPQAASDLRATYGIAPEAPLVGYAGQLLAAKGLDCLVDAFAMVEGRLPSSRLLIMGRGEHEARLRERVLRAGLKSKVIFTGHLSDISSALGALDVFVLPSQFTEGLSRVLIEAMACARPVIATARGGNLETVVEGETGLLFPCADSAALAEKLLSLLDDPDLRKEMGRKARARAERLFDSRKTSQCIHRLYEELLEAR
jgi:glycosyltransferase involved in cell wall biosynthesis